MSRTYRKTNRIFGFHKEQYLDLVKRHSTGDLIDHELTEYQSIINSDKFDKALLNKYYITDIRKGYQFVIPKWVYKKKARTIRRVTKRILNKLDLMDVEDVGIIPTRLPIIYFH